VPAIPALRRLRQEEQGFQANLGYIVRPCLKNKTEQNKKRKEKAYSIFAICSNAGSCLPLPLSCIANLKCFSNFPPV
jgi:hypothetical protein